MPTELNTSVCLPKWTPPNKRSETCPGGPQRPSFPITVRWRTQIISKGTLNGNNENRNQIMKAPLTVSKLAEIGGEKDPFIFGANRSPLWPKLISNNAEISPHAQVVPANLWHKCVPGLQTGVACVLGVSPHFRCITAEGQTKRSIPRQK